MVKKTLLIPDEVAAAVDNALHDPVLARPRYGAWSELVSGLLIAWLNDGGNHDLSADIQACRDLLAVIHRDDGARRELVGTRRAADEAIEIVCTMRARLDELEGTPE